MARDAMLLRAASTGAPLPEGLEAALDLGASATFPVTAKDLMPRLQGPALGARLAQLQRRWIDSGFTATKDALLSSE